MEKIYIKNNFAVSVKREKNDINGNPRYAINIFAKLGSSKEYDNINLLCYTKKFNIGRYSKTLNIFTITAYNIPEKIENIFSEIENIFNE